MKHNKGKSEESDGSNTDEEISSLLGKGQQPVQERKDWDVFTNNPPVEITGSMADQTCMQVSLQIVKVLAYICTFILVLGGAVLSKGTLLFMTSQLRDDTTIEFCSEIINDQMQLTAELPPEERVGWIWCLFFAYVIPEIFTFLRASRICFFKKVTKPTILQFCVVATAETLRTIGTGLLVFMILPNLNVVKGAMLTNCLCFVPGLIALFNGLQGEVKGTPGAAYYIRQTINGLAVAAQLTGFLMWPIFYYDHLSLSILHPIVLLLISCGWWENFMAATKIPAVVKFLHDLKDCRYYTLLYVSVWKIVCFFCIMLMVTEFQFESLTVGDLFNLFSETFSPRNITVTPVLASGYSSLPNHTDVLDSGEVFLVEATSSSALWVLLIHAVGSYICYITGKFACRILIQEIGYALPVTITVPVVISLLITFCYLRSSDSCYFEGIIPDYLFFNSPDFNNLEKYLSEEHVWLWLLWLLSQFWITRHIWKPNVDHLMSTEVLFTMPMYDSMFVDQSLALNRRHDKERAMLIEDMEPGDDFVRDSDHMSRVFACVTMWHETPGEIKQILKSLFRLDNDQSARRLAQRHMNVVDPDYYEFEAHIFFDDAFELNEDDEVVVNKYVTDLLDTVDIAASEVHGTECHIRPPVKFPTPYGGRLVWTLPGETEMIVHLKNKDKIRRKKRWSQVMYMYYLLGHRLMELPISLERKEVIAKNTFILALDGDIDFKPEAVLLLLDRMKKYPKLGAASGRIHPTGEGPMVWYQKFEYAIGHWMQKATEHVIGCVLCGPGCFTLFRGKALMDDAVMNKYAAVPKEARHFIQYDQGEDRWLSTLLLQRGYRVEYLAASDAYTHCPESFDEFYKQRRRWIPSTMANTIDLLMNYKQTVKINNNISFFYIIYQTVLLLGSILGSGNIFLMLVGAFVAAFRIGNWPSFFLNIVPILIFMFVCYFCKERIQLSAAKIISAMYGLVMMAVLIGIMLQIAEDGPLAPAPLFFFIVVGLIVIAAILHPQEFWCLPAGVVFFVTVPSMYMLLIVYTIFNLNVVTWGTREVATKKSKRELEQEQKAAEGAKKQEKQKPLWGFLRGDQKNKDGGEGPFEFSKMGLFTCNCCTHTNGGEERIKLLHIGNSSENLKRGTDNSERAVDPAPQTQQPKRTTFRFNKRDLKPVMENEENNLDEDSDSFTDNDDNESKEVRNDQVNPYWIDQPEMKGDIDFLHSQEVHFWNDLIDKYLFVLKNDVYKEQSDSKNLKDLRDLAVFAFFMLNALFVLVVFLLHLSGDQLHIRWPLHVRATITVDETSGEPITSEHLQLDPIGLLFLVGFGIILLLQFIAMLFHRFGTLSHMLAATQITCFRRAARDMNAKIAVQLAKDMQSLRGAYRDVLKEQDLMQPEVEERKTIHNIEASHNFPKEKYAVGSLDTAFKWQLSQLRGEFLQRHERPTSARRGLIRLFIEFARREEAYRKLEEEARARLEEASRKLEEEAFARREEASRKLEEEAFARREEATRRLEEEALASPETFRSNSDTNKGVNVHPSIYQSMEFAQQKKLNPYVEAARKSVDEERRNIHERRQSISLHLNDKRAGSMRTITEED